MRSRTGKRTSLGRQARAALYAQGHRRELLARCDEDAAAAGDAARRHEPVPQQLRLQLGEIAELEGDGNYDCTWVLGKSENCQTCAQRAADWAPLQIREGRLVMPSMQVIVPKDLILDPQKLARAAANAPGRRGQGRDSGLSDDHRHRGSPGRF